MDLSRERESKQTNYTRTKKLKSSSNQNGPYGFSGYIYQTVKEKIIPILLKTVFRRWDIFKFFIYSEYNAPQTWWKLQQKGNYRPVSLITFDVKILNKLSANTIQQHIKIKKVWLSRFYSRNVKVDQY